MGEVIQRVYLPPHPGSTDCVVNGEKGGKLTFARRRGFLDTREESIIAITASRRSLLAPPPRQHVHRPSRTPL